MQDHDDLPKVVGGKLTKPYPIKTMGDVSRARVLPPPASAAAAPAKAAAAPKPVVHDEQPKGAFDYVRKRNALSREISGRR